MQVELRRLMTRHSDRLGSMVSIHLEPKSISAALLDRLDSGRFVSIIASSKYCRFTIPCHSASVLASGPDADLVVSYFAL